MKPSRDGWLAIGILFALVLVISAAVVQETKKVEIPYFSSSSAPNGTLALKMWLNDLGYKSAESSATFNPHESMKTIFILQPTELISENEWKLIDKWVEQGGCWCWLGITIIPSSP